MQKFTPISEFSGSERRTLYGPSPRVVLRRVLSGTRLEDATRLLQARELQRAREFGMRWRLLSDLGGLSVAVAIARGDGETVGQLADRLQSAGVASRSRVHGLVRTLAHLDGVGSAPHPRDRRLKRLVARPWLDQFLDDWADGHHAAARLCLGEPAGAMELPGFDLAPPAAIGAAGPFERFGWLLHAVGGTLWLLTLLAGSGPRAGAAVPAEISLKALSRDTGVSRAHFARLRALAETRGLLRRNADGQGVQLSRRFHARARACVGRWLAAVAAAGPARFLHWEGEARHGHASGQGRSR